MGMKFIQFYFTWREALSSLSDEECGRVVKALMDYATGNPVQPFPAGSRESLSFSFMARQFDTDRESYECRADKNRINGRSGGAPAGNQNAKKAPESSKTTQTTERLFSLPHEGKGREGKGRESSSNKGDAPAALDDNDDPALADILNRCEQQLPSVTPFIRRQVQDYVWELGAELVEAVLDECIRNGAQKWAYLRVALEDCKTRGVTAEEYRKAHGSKAKAQTVDRPEPSGKDILARRRPIRLKRED